MAHVIPDKTIGVTQPNGCWPKKYDEDFVRYAGRMSTLLKFKFVKEFAQELLDKGRLEHDEIAAIGTRHRLLRKPPPGF